jgi:hypothetical protein
MKSGSADGFISRAAFAKVGGALRDDDSEPPSSPAQMPPIFRVVVLALACAVATRAAAADVSSPAKAPTTVAAAKPLAERLQAARDRAVAFFGQQVHAADPSWLSLFGYMHRRFGTNVKLATGKDLHDLQEGVARPETYAIYRRIDDPNATVEKAQIAALPTPIDRITASALHCDRIKLPPDWIQVLRNASHAEAYALTHAVLATEWTIENGCLERRDVEQLHAEQVKLLEDLIRSRYALAKTMAPATDLWFEAMAMLDYAGESGRIQPKWVEEMLTLQRADGGWARHPRGTKSDAHTSTLALWIVLQQLAPEAPHIRWIAQQRAAP